MSSSWFRFRRSTTFIILVSTLVAAVAGAVFGYFAATSYAPPIDEIIRRVYERPKEEIKVEKPTGPVISQEQAVVSVAKAVSPSVVSIIVTKDLPVLERFFSDPFGDFFGRDFFGPFDFKIPQYRQKGSEKRQIGGGTGFVISEDGLILTNRHVVQDKEAQYTVIFNDGSKFPAKVLARDPGLDLAIVRIEKKGLKPIPLGDSEKIQVGQSVIAIGNALGEFRNTVSVGVISGLSRSIVASGGAGTSEQLEDVIQTDAAINPGNSGGPLLSIRGEVIGVNVAVALGAQNIGFAIPINFAKKDISDSIKFGKIVTPYLGVRYLMINKLMREKNNLPVDFGALILRGDQGELAVVPGSPADKAGLRENDIILELDGKKIEGKNTLARLIQSKNVGDIVKLKVLSKGEEKIVSLKLEERP